MPRHDGATAVHIDMGASPNQADAWNLAPLSRQRLFPERPSTSWALAINLSAIAWALIL